jgi:hypothetical protein
MQKLISGRYLGEILRLVICELIDEGVLFLGQNTYKIEMPYSLDTAFLSLMERCGNFGIDRPRVYIKSPAIQRSNGRTFDDHRDFLTLLRP